MGLLGNLVGKAITGIGNLIKNAKAGKAALASGYMPGATPAQTATTKASTSGAPLDEMPWYKQPWVIPLGVGTLIVTIIGILFALFKPKK